MLTNIQAAMLEGGDMLTMTLADYDNGDYEEHPAYIIDVQVKEWGPVILHMVAFPIISDMTVIVPVSGLRGFESVPINL